MCPPTPLRFASTLGPDRGCAGRDLAADAVGLLDALGVSAAHVVGFSTLGGSTAQRMAIEHPARVASLTTISCGTAEFGMPAPDAEAQKALTAIAEGADGADPISSFVEAGRALMAPAHFDEGRVKAAAAAALERAPPVAGTQQICTRRQMCANVAEEPRIFQLQVRAQPHTHLPQLVPPLIGHGVCSQKATSAMARSPSCARGKLSARLTTTEKITPTEVTAKAYTAFVCEVRMGDELINTKKERYSSFLDLRDRLEKESAWKDQVRHICAKTSTGWF